MNILKKIFSFIIILSIVFSLMLFTGCDDAEYDVVLEVSKSSVFADGKDRVELTAVVKTKGGRVIKTDDVEFYQDRTNSDRELKLPLLIPFSEFRTTESGRHELYAKYKNSESKRVLIRTGDSPSREVKITTNKYNIKSTGSARLEINVHDMKGKIVNEEAEIFETMRPESSNAGKIGSTFKSSETGVHFIYGRGIERAADKSLSNVVAINVTDVGDEVLNNTLSLSSSGAYVMGASSPVKLKAVLTNSDGDKLDSSSVEFYEMNNKLDGSEFTPKAAGKYYIYAKCNGIISNTIEVTARDAEFIDAESTKLPVVVINTDGRMINSGNKVEATMAVYNNASGENKISDKPELVTNIKIKMRGQSSMTFPKKQYGIELKDNNWEDTSYSVMGMGAEEDWVLNGSYADKSLMRNYIAYSLAAQCTEYASETRFCEVYINDSDDVENPYNYMGIYLMIEKIKIDENRVDIDKLDKSITSGDKLTGGYIVSKDKIKEGEWSLQTGHGNLALVSPNEDKINGEQYDYISNYMSSFFNALFSENYKNPKTGYAKYIDLESYATVLAINELTKCIDGMNISLYYYKPRNEKLRAGPAWDFDLSMGNVDYRTGTDPEGWYCVSLDEVPRRMLSDSAFKIMFKTKWNELRETVFSDGNINATINKALETISGEPIERSVKRWPGQWNGMFVWPNPVDEENYTSSHEEEVEALRNFLLKRAAWIEENISGTIDLNPVHYNWINEYTGERMPREDYRENGNGNWRGRN